MAYLIVTENVSDKMETIEGDVSTFVDVEHEIEVVGNETSETIVRSIENSGLDASKHDEAVDVNMDSEANAAPEMLQVLSAVAAAVHTEGVTSFTLDSHDVNNITINTAGEGAQSNTVTDKTGQLRTTDGVTVILPLPAAAQEAIEENSADAYPKPTGSVRHSKIPTQIGAQVAKVPRDHIGPSVLFLTNIPHIIFRQIDEVKGNTIFWIGNHDEPADIPGPHNVVMTDNETGIQLCVSLKRTFIKKIMMGEDIIFYIARWSNEKTVLSMLQTLYEIKYFGTVLPHGKAKTAVRLMTNGETAGILGEDHDYQKKIDSAQNSSKEQISLIDVNVDYLDSGTIECGERNLDSPSVFLSAVNTSDKSAASELDTGAHSQALASSITTEEPVCEDSSDDESLLIATINSDAKNSSVLEKNISKKEDPQAGSLGTAKRKRGHPQKLIPVEAVSEQKTPVNENTEELGKGKRRVRRPHRLGSYVLDAIKTEMDDIDSASVKRPVGRPRKIRGLHKVAEACPRKVITKGPRNNSKSSEMSNGEASRKNSGGSTGSNVVAQGNHEVSTYVKPDGTKVGMWKALSYSCPSSIMRKARMDVQNYCPECLTLHQGPQQHESCYLTNPMWVVSNPKACDNNEAQSTNSVPDHLCLRVNEQNKLSVYSFRNLPASMQFGPLIGILMTESDITEAMNLDDVWFLRYNEDGERYFLYTGQQNSSNWCRYMTPVFREDYNVVMVLREEGIFFVTSKVIPAGQLLKVHIPYFGNKDRVLAEDMAFCECPTCLQVFSSPLNLQKHWHIVHPYGLIKKKAMCRVCGKVLPSIKQLEVHCRAEHAGQGGYPCADCSMVFYHQYKLRQHRWTCHPPPEAAVTCPQCGKTYKNEQSLKSHVQHTHSVMTFTCSICSKIFNKKIVLMRHMKTHTESAQHKCETCGRAFRMAWNLKIHMNTHTKEKPFLCLKCDRGVASKTLLKEHYINVHGYNEKNMPPITRRHLSVYDEVPKKSRRFPPLANPPTDTVGPMLPLEESAHERELERQASGSVDVSKTQMEELSSLQSSGENLVELVVSDVKTEEVVHEHVVELSCEQMMAVSGEVTVGQDGDSSSGYLTLKIGDQEVRLPHADSDCL